MLSPHSSQSIVISVVPEDHEFKVPQRAVKTPSDMPLWEKSEAYSEYLGFILSLNDVIKAKPLSVPCLISDNVKQIIELLNKLNKITDEVKPIQQPQRYGNQAFRQWYNQVTEKAADLIKEALPERFHRAVCELSPYLIDGFGNSTRIDYGTGHEISFLMFLCCLFKIGVFLEEDRLAVATNVFPKYLDVVRKLQQTYRMEPAGSHGVWSLDDFQFVPFIWGSSQLIAHPKIEPSSFVEQNIVKQYARDYMFLGCIEYINKVKTGHFAEHSNQLWGISAVAHWTKVNSGLIKMYKVEVLGKYPVIQHCVFGSLLPFKALSRESTTTSEISLSVGSSDLSTTPRITDDSLVTDTPDDTQLEEEIVEKEAVEEVKEAVEEVKEAVEEVKEAVKEEVKEEVKEDEPVQ